MRLATETVLQYSTLILQSRRVHSIDFRITSTDASLGYPADAFLSSWIFRIVSDSTLNFFTASRGSWIFWNFEKDTQEKQRDDNV